MFYALDFDIDDSSFLITSPEYNQDLDPKLKLDSPVSKIINTTTKENDSKLTYEVDYIDFVNNWFPEINAHVFISHSHQDKEKAVALANFLYKRLGIKSFIDSEVWGYLDEAMLKLNKRFNAVDGEENTYIYGECNKLAGCLNLILSSALTKMIDSADSLFFINTANSVHDGVKTKSPWIFTEILLSSMLEKKSHADRLEHLKMESFEGIVGTEVRKGVSFSFPLGMEHMYKVTSEMLEKIRDDAESKIENGDLTPNFTNNDIFKNLDAIYNVAVGKY
ncbi:hypothetical protein DAP02_20115 [Salmonella enterica subsp. enterica serovar Enteritidis]|nr:hypothetical protein [Salmonella enterica subsp. enterica serovar Enteritidis]